MKKILMIALAALLVLSMAACGTINDAEVAVLWSGGDQAVIPNSLINAMDRAMYIENIAYRYYGAEGKQETQTKQAGEALNSGCSALLVELVNPAAAQEIIDLAKAKNVPVVFFGCDVAASVVSGYDKCVLVNTDEATLAPKQAEMISEYLAENAEDLDRNGDGKIAYAKVGEVTTQVAAEDVTVEEVTIDVTMLQPETVELIVTGNDIDAMYTLLALQAQDYNTNKLVTQFVALFTVGNEADYKAHVRDGAPADGPERKAYYEAKKHLVDLTTVSEEDLEEMIYTTVNVIDTGRISGTVQEDYDAIAVTVAAITRNLLTGKTATEGVEGADGQTVSVAYTTYTG